MFPVKFMGKMSTCVTGFEFHLSMTGWDDTWLFTEKWWSSKYSVLSYWVVIYLGVIIGVFTLFFIRREIVGFGIILFLYWFIFSFVKLFNEFRFALLFANTFLTRNYGRIVNWLNRFQGVVPVIFFLLILHKTVLSKKRFFFI